MRKRVLYVAVEPPWPANQGGRVRMAGTIEAIAEAHDVEVLTWSNEPAAPAPVQVTTIDRTFSGTFAGFMSPQPRIMRQVAGRSGLAEAAEFIANSRCEVVMFSHSYVAACVRTPSRPRIVDLANVEHLRYRSFAQKGRIGNRASALVEFTKAIHWERHVVQTADLVIALSEEDQAWANRAGGNTLLAPNGTQRPPSVAPSASSAHALYFASMDYGPNQEGASFLINEVWPRVRAQVPNALLQIAGRGSSDRLGRNPGAGIQVVGGVSDVDRLYREAGLVLAPVTRGAGKQLKIVEALAHGRSLVCTDYSVESVPPGLRDVVWNGSSAAAFASAVVEGLQNSQKRWANEATIRARRQFVPSWRESAASLVEWIGDTA